VRIEHTQDGVNRLASDLKSEPATRPETLPYICYKSVALYHTAIAFASKKRQMKIVQT